MKKNRLRKLTAVVLSTKFPLVISLCAFLIISLFFISCTTLDGTVPEASETSGEAETSSESQPEENSGDNGTEPESGEEGSGAEEGSQEEETGEGGEAAEAGAESGELTINVYYADSMGEFLVGEGRTVSAENKYVDALNELMKLPADASLHRLIPDTAIINSVSVEDGIAKADFSSNFVDDRFQGDTVDILLIYSVVNTLTEFPEVHAVEFYINGEKLDLLGEIDISVPVFRKSDLIKGG